MDNIFADLVPQSPVLPQPPVTIPVTDITKTKDVVGLMGTDSFADIEQRADSLQITPDEKRGFFGNVAEAYRRGDAMALANMAMSDADFHGEDVAAVNTLRHAIMRKEQLDPIQTNFLQGLIIKGAEMVPSIFRSVGYAVPYAGAGAVIGGTIAAVAGQLGPQAALPEEIATIPAGIIAGAGFGMKTGMTMFWFKQAQGSLLGTMLDKGYDPKVSSWVAQGAALPIALLTQLQIGKLAPAALASETTIPAVKATVLNVMERFGASYGEKMATIGGAAIAMQVANVAAEDIAGKLSGKDIGFDKQGFLDRVKRVASGTWENIQSMAVLTAATSAMDTAKQTVVANAKYNVQQEALKNTPGYPEEGLVTAEATRGFEYQPNETPVGTTEGVLVRDAYGNVLPKGAQPDYFNQITDPLGQVIYALRESVDNYANKAEALSKQLGEKFGKAEERMWDPALSAREASRAALGALKGQAEKFNIEPIESRLPVSSWESLFGEIRDAWSNNKVSTPEYINISNALEMFIKKGELMQPNQIKSLAKIFGPQIADVMTELQIAIDTKIKGGKIKTSKTDAVLDAMNTPKALMASGDLSRTWRQNILTVGKGLTKGFEFELKSLMNSDDAIAGIYRDFETSAYAALRRRTTLRINKWKPGSETLSRSERFQGGQWMSKIPVLGEALQATERAYVEGGNLLRMWLFDKIASEWENTGKSAKDYQDLAHVVNIITGEGDARIIKSMGKLAPAVNALFFAPRFAISRFQAIYELANPRLSNAARKVLAAQVVKFVALNSGILAVASQIPGLHIGSINPQSTDFGKIRYGNVTLDFWGGYSQIARIVAQGIAGTKLSMTGKKLDVERIDIVSRFLRSKLGPIPAYIVDNLTGTTFAGKDTTSMTADEKSNAVLQMLAPLFIQDTADAIVNQGLGGALLAAPASFLGVGVQTSPTDPKIEIQLRQDALAQETFGQKWETLGPDVQAMLTEQSPRIQQIDMQLKAAQNNPNYLVKVAKDEQKSERRVRGQLGADVIQVLDNTFVKVGGCSKRISTDWVLNDARYREYEDTTAKLISGVVREMVKDPQWATYPIEVQQEVLANTIAQIKASVRKQIVNSAQVKDLISMEQILQGGR